MLLKGRKILLGITAGIAAYKIPMLVRHLVNEGANVQVILTPDSKDFVTPLTLSVLSNKPVYSEFFHRETGEWYNHVKLAYSFDLFLIAPCTANTISKMANAQADNLLLATYLSAKIPVMIAPAMDLDMWKHPDVQNNLNKLKKNSVNVLMPDSGFLASGLNGEGRMQEPEKIVKEVIHFLAQNQLFTNKKVLITNGPTREYLDDVRYISNASSGKMGFSIADAFIRQGANVTMICGPVNEQFINESFTIEKVNSAEDMFLLFQKHFDNNEIIICVAAVSDYRPKNKHLGKIKKHNETLQIELVKNPDILKWAGQHKKNGQMVVGFALESENPLENALLKLKNKNADVIILNTTKNEGTTFESNQNAIMFVKGNETNEDYIFGSKEYLGNIIVQKISEFKS